MNDKKQGFAMMIGNTTYIVEVSSTKTTREIESVIKRIITDEVAHEAREQAS